MLANIKDGVICFDDGSQYLNTIPHNLEKYCIPNNAIVLTKIGSPNFKSAVAQVSEGHHLLANGNMYVIELDEEKVNPYYIQAFFESTDGIATFQHIFTGATLKTISVENLKKILIPLPHIDVQNKIAVEYQAASDEYVILKRKIKKAVDQMEHIMDEER